jgi:hypothetical protein
MGGSGKVKDVLKRVEDNMKGTLKKCDYEPLSSNRDTLRWDNTARWARNSMINDGLLKSDSAHGVWEISEAGRRFLKG